MLGMPQAGVEVNCVVLWIAASHSSAPLFNKSGTVHSLFTLL